MTERDGQRIVPGADDADYAEGFVVEAAGFGFCGEAVVRDAFGLEKVLRVFGKIFGGVESDENIGEERFAAGLAGFGTTASASSLREASICSRSLRNRAQRSWIGRLAHSACAARAFATIRNKADGGVFSK